MILFELKCGGGHGFEAWFRDGATYEAQAANAEIACPVCGDTHIVKAPMAPRIAKGPVGDRTAADRPDSSGRSATVMVSGETRARLEALRRHIEETCDAVGPDFAEEARRIHYGEIPHRDIYGDATEDEAAELADEGVAFARIPWPPRTDS